MWRLLEVGEKRCGEDEVYGRLFGVWRPVRQSSIGTVMKKDSLPVRRRVDLSGLKMAAHGESAAWYNAGVNVAFERFRA